METLHIHELLIKLKEEYISSNHNHNTNLNHSHHPGLCSIIWGGNTFVGEEILVLNDYLVKNKPLKYVLLQPIVEVFEIRSYLYGGYYWKEGHVEPRLKWLDKHIKRTKRK